MNFRLTANDRRRGEPRRLEDRRRRQLRPTLLALEERKLLSTIVVNNPTDTPVAGQIDLRQAIDMANTNGGDEVITFDRAVFAKPQTIRLASGQLELSDTSEPITIKGPGAGDLTIDAGGTSRVFAIDPGVTASISGLTITGGASDGRYVSGGDLLNQGNLTLTGVTVSGGYAYAGGGLSNSGTATLVDSTIADNIGNRGAGLFNGGSSEFVPTEPTMTLEDCTVTGNTGAPVGGFESVSLGAGLFNWGSLTMTGGSITGDTANIGSAVYSGFAGVTNLKRTTIQDNPSAGYPGTYELIFNDGGSMSLADCTISGDSSTPIAGFGIKNYYYGQLDLANCTVEGFSRGGIDNSYSSTLNMSGCQIINNTGKGGLVNEQYANATLTGCIISGNTTSGDGGGIFNTGTVTLTGCTLRDNMASGPGGGLFNGGQATVTGCTVRGNSASVGGGIDNAGQLTATDVALSGNSAATGGAIANAAGATATVSGSEIIANDAAGDGGGVANAGTITLTATLIGGNTAAGDGGGLYDSGTAALVNCLVSGNSSASGGGIYAAAGGSVTLTGSLVIFNKKDNIVGTVTYD
jgi:Right handed beta helix region